MKSGLRPLIERIDIAYDNWKEREIFWIAYFKSRGFDLTNHTPGGDEIDKAAVAAAWTPERRKRQSEIAKMVNARPSKKAQQAALMSQVNKEYVLGKPWTDKQRANRSKNKKFNAWLSNRMREINASRAGKPWTENRRNAQIAAKAKRTSENRESL